MKILIKNINNFNKINYLLSYFCIKKEKKRIIKKIIKKEAKYRSILGEYLLINGLKKIFNESYRKINIETNKYGKPYIKNKNIYYNISHSYDYVICGFNEKQIGVDIEKIRTININNVKQFATDNEKMYIFENEKLIYERTFEIYTLKEAYFKMKGTNLNNIKNIEFIINNNKITCSDKSVSLKLIKYVENYIIAICFKK